jgi:predicted acyl esterase
VIDSDLAPPERAASTSESARFSSASGRLVDVFPRLVRLLTSTDAETQPRFSVEDIRRETVRVAMRDRTRLATDIYFPPCQRAPAVIIRTPYGRARPRLIPVLMTMARHGYVAISQDGRGTGDSEPDSWDYYVYESEDSYDLVQWASEQAWYSGFIGSFGSSYDAQVQWCMSMHPRMSTIVPEVSGLGVAVNTARLHMFVNAYARSVGKGAGKVEVPYEELESRMLEETLQTGYFNEPLFPPTPPALLDCFPHLPDRLVPQTQRWLWEHYCSLSCSERAAFIKRVRAVPSVTISDVESMSSLFGYSVSHDALTLPHPRPPELYRSLHAPALMITGWYDWGLNDALASWQLLTAHASEPVRAHSRLIITPSAHNVPGYHEGSSDHPELQHNHRVSSHIELLLFWYSSMADSTLRTWPRVIYYMLGANEWRYASEWPPRQSTPTRIYLREGGQLGIEPAQQGTAPDEYVYDPQQPTPTAGGSIVSYVYPPGSVDVSEVQSRSDVLVYTTQPLEHDLDVAGPLRLVLYASSSAIDTDFAARLSDVTPDGRAIQLQAGILRARYRNPDGDPQLLTPGDIYRLEIDMWAIANRFRAGHRLRVDISSADFPRFDRNTNGAGVLPGPQPARQTIYHDSEHPSHLLLCVLSPDPP